MRTKQQACDAKNQGYKGQKPTPKQDGFFRKTPSPSTPSNRE